MRTLLSALTCLTFLLLSPTVFADTMTPAQGVYLQTDYPAITARPGTSSTIPLKLINRGEPPTRLQLQVDDLPKTWKATFLGGGQPVTAAMPATDDTVTLDLKLEIPADAGNQPETVTVIAESATSRLTLPIQVALAKELPARLTLETDLPELKGSASSSFDYKATIKNDSGKDMLVSLAATAPEYFQTKFTEGYGSQELSSLPIKAGESKDIKLKVSPPGMVKPGTYPVTINIVAGDAKANAELKMEIVGRPKLALSGRNGLMSTKAEIDTASTFPIIVANTGGAQASNVKLSGTAPSGWKIEFSPKTIQTLDPRKTEEVQVSITPSSESLVGDYMVSLNASSQGEAASGDLRVSVVTSSLWGITGAIILAIAVLILVGAVARFGRR